jgi:tripartite-type tricarboxylate transporter receptor subunit TctC
MESFMKFTSKAWVLLSLLTGLIHGPAQASDDFPNRPITMVIGFPPGGSADVIGRNIAERLAKSLGKAVVVSNQPGFGGNLAAAAVKKASADGYTVLFAPWTSTALNGAVYGVPRVGYSLEKDFAAVSTVASQPMVLVTSSTVSAKSTAELIALGKATPGALAFASSGAGTMEHVAGELIARRAGISMLHVPFKGTGPAMIDLMAGRIQVYMVSAAAVVSNLTNPKIRVLMVASKERSPALPDVPTADEAGVANLRISQGYGVLVPTGTPASVVKKLNESLVALLQAPDLKATLRDMGAVTEPSSPQEFTARIAAEVASWEQTIKREQIKVEQ